VATHRAATERLARPCAQGQAHMREAAGTYDTHALNRRAENLSAAARQQQRPNDGTPTHAESLTAIIGMGFSAEQATVALAACGGSMMHAIEQLLAAGEPEAEAEPEPEPEPEPPVAAPAEREWIIPVAEVEVQGLIGRGALGEVHRGICRGITVALKSLHLLRTDPASIQAMGGVELDEAERRHVLDSFMAECELLRRACAHPNIVPFVGMVTDAEPLYLATEYCPDGTLHDVLYASRHAGLRTAAHGRLPVATQLLVSMGIFEALTFLATLPMIHRDIKPANILVVCTQDGQLEKAMLADFGEAKLLTQTMTMQTMAGTPVYMAPEMAAEEDAKGPKADVFSAVRNAQCYNIYTFTQLHYY
jgi:hypothetical protein